MAVALIIDIDKAIRESPLTKREEAILELIKEEYTHKEIAEQLDIHRANVTRSLGNIINKITKQMEGG